MKNINDEYYVNQVKFNSAYAKFQLSKLEKNNEIKHLEYALNLLKE